MHEKARLVIVPTALVADLESWLRRRGLELHATRQAGYWVVGPANAPEEEP